MNTSLEIENPEYPKIYLKQERINLNSLAKPYGQEYMFWSKDGGIKNCVKLLNNLNELVARCFHKTNKLSYYFGISKDPEPENKPLFHNFIKSLKQEENVLCTEIKTTVNNIDLQTVELMKECSDIKESLSEILVLLNNINNKT